MVFFSSTPLLYSMSSSRSLCSAKNSPILYQRLCDDGEMSQLHQHLRTKIFIAMPSQVASQTARAQYTFCSYSTSALAIQSIPYGARCLMRDISESNFKTHCMCLSGLALCRHDRRIIEIRSDYISSSHTRLIRCLTHWSSYANKH